MTHAADLDKRWNAFRTVLLAEDDHILRKTLAYFMEDHGLRVIEAENGSKALRLYTEYENEIDLVFSDVIMPGLSGLDLAKINLSRQNLPFVIFTGVALPELTTGTFDCGIKDCLVKPIDFDRLLLTLKSVLLRWKHNSVIDGGSAFDTGLSQITIKPEFELVSGAYNWIYKKSKVSGVKKLDDLAMMGIYEFLMNAYEHGCLKIHAQEKERLLSSDKYTEMLPILESKYRSEKITVGFSISGENAIVTIADTGAGFDYKMFLETTLEEYLKRIRQLCGRGIVMGKRHLDKVVYSNGGRTVTLTRKLTAVDEII
jgi:DNA-binding response OmpR family regulator